jgi:hypothetical protein
MEIRFILILIALICFIGAAFGVSARNINLTAAGLALLTVTLLI